MKNNKKKTSNKYVNKDDGDKKIKFRVLNFKIPDSEFKDSNFSPIQLAVKKVTSLQYDIYMLNYDLYYKKNVNGKIKEIKLSNEPIERILGYYTDKINEDTGFHEIEVIHISTFNEDGHKMILTLFDPEYLKGEIDSSVNALSSILTFMHNQGSIKLVPKDNFKESDPLTDEEVKRLIEKENEENDENMFTI